jgi:hypothetical protein
MMSPALAFVLGVVLGSAVTGLVVLVVERWWR